MIRMIGQYYYKVIGIILFLLMSIEVQGATFIEQKGIVSSPYEVNFTGVKAMISRDGSEAQSLSNKKVITKPGTYYVSVWDESNSQKLFMFTIKPKREKNTYVIKNQGDLEEAFKDILGQYKTEIKIQMEYGNYSVEQLNDHLYKALEAAMNKYPLLTFEQYEIRSRGGYKPLAEMTIRYPADPSMLRKYETSGKETMNQIIQTTLSPQLADYEKEWKVYDYLVKRITYSTQVVNGNAPPLTHTIQGTLSDKGAVCDGYAKTLMYLLNMVGVPTQMIVGVATDFRGNTEPHAWNLVNIQGGTYHVDATWGDMDKGQVGPFYNYFNENDSYMNKTHRWDVAKYPKASTMSYSLVYMPMTIKGMYKVNTPSEWQTVLSQIGKEHYVEGSIILLGDNRIDWDENSMLEDLTNRLGSSLQYRIDEKYNAKIICYIATD